MDLIPHYTAKAQSFVKDMQALSSRVQKSKQKAHAIIKSQEQQKNAARSGPS